MPACLEMDHQVPSSQDLVSLIVVPGLEPEGLVERARSADVLRGQNWFCSFSRHGDLLSGPVRSGSPSPARMLAPRQPFGLHRATRERRVWKLGVGSWGAQVLKSGTSAGANYEETDDGSSPRDVLAKRRIVLRELKETSFRLRVLRKAGILAPAHDPVITECAELVRIVGALIRNYWNGFSPSSAACLTWSSIHFWNSSGPRTVTNPRMWA